MTKEQQIEDALIGKLKDLKYTYRDDIRDKDSLEKNFQEKFEALNQVTLTDTEFSRLRDEIITYDVFAAAQTLRERNTFTREDGTHLQYTLVNIKDWCKNDYEVINQLRINTDNSYHRYDVILLINGVPVVQIELKMLDVSPRRAMEQIVHYKNDPGNGYTNTLLCFVQLFIVSNENNTFYFANNDKKHFNFNAEERFLPIYQLADKENNTIVHLHDFAEGFLAKCALGKMISRYMVLIVSEKRLLIMRSYQIYAVKAIVDCIQQNRGNGYVWHTTGSGKTLTSFKASTLLKDYPNIEKCLFVVDRKDLDRQTREEFNKFQEGCVEENTNTRALVRRMLSDDYADKVIVTTIQKLGLALDENSKRNKFRKGKGRVTYKEQLKPLRDKRMVFIFDECHRSQFGENHRLIKEFFPKAQLFGFTGTPIFEENAIYRRIDGNLSSLKTTEAIFEKELHAYTITNAIDDRNVLRFHIDYFGERAKDNKGDKKGVRPKLSAPESVVDEILKKHDAATNQRRFNAILATDSINSAIEYYELFKQAQAQRLKEEESYTPLNIACVFSPPAEGNKDVRQIQEDLPQEKKDNKEEPDKKKKALSAIIDDYNAQYGTNHSINEFDLYYQDVQKRIKDQEYANKDYPRRNKIDIVIVVDMLLTGFDSKYLNTLYADKNLKHHGLIQAFSRTNRILNDTKPYGNILDFRYQEEAVNQAIALFSGRDLSRAKEIWLVDSAPEVIEKFKGAVEKLENFMRDRGLDCVPSQVANLKGDSDRVEFINRFKEVQRLKTQLDQYTDLGDEGSEKIEQLMPEDQMRAFRGVYLDTAQSLKEQQGRNADGNNLEVQQTDFEFVLFASAVIDYDYIMNLLSKYTEGKPSKEKMTREQIISLVCSDANLMDEHDLVTYIESLQVGERLSEKAINEGYQKFKEDKFTEDLVVIAKKHEISEGSLQTFVDDVIEVMIFDAGRLSDLFTPLSLNWKVRAQKELAFMKDLGPLLKKRAGAREISGLSAYE